MRKSGLAGTSSHGATLMSGLCQKGQRNNKIGWRRMHDGKLPIMGPAWRDFSPPYAKDNCSKDQAESWASQAYFVFPEESTKNKDTLFGCHCLKMVSSGVQNGNSESIEQIISRAKIIPING